MISINFSSGPGDAGDPAALIIRSSVDGVVSMTVVPGHNKDINEALSSMRAIVDSVGFERFIKAARESVLASGVPLSVIRQEDDIPDIPEN